MKHSDLSDADCAIAQALGVVGDWWTLLVIRDVAGGITRFDELQRELDVSRRTLTERLKMLVEHGVLDKVRYAQHPPRFEYHLTDAGRGLLPVLISLQDWGTRFVSGDGSLTATSTPTSVEAKRVHALVGRKVPSMRLRTDAGRSVDPLGETWSVLYCFPGAFAPADRGYPPGWSDIPGARGCTLESTTYRDRYADFARLGVAVHGVSTQRPDQLRAFSEHVSLPFVLLSDEDLALTAALRLPTFRAAGVDRLKRATLIIDPTRTVRAVQYPVVDPAASATDALAQLAVSFEREGRQAQEREPS